MRWRRMLWVSALGLSLLVAVIVAASAGANRAGKPTAATVSPAWQGSGTSEAGGGDHGVGHGCSPIKHLVVIFQENASFDHFFGTYPNAANPPGEPRFVAKPGTP